MMTTCRMRVLKVQSYVCESSNLIGGKGERYITVYYITLRYVTFQSDWREGLSVKGNPLAVINQSYFIFVC